MEKKVLMPPTFIIYADGACRKNPGPGGWGALIFHTQDSSVVELGGHASHTTNNRMELEAVRATLTHIQNIKGSSCFYLDSSYVLQGIQSWVYTWKRNQWMTASGSSVVNADLWQDLHVLVEARLQHSPIEWKHVYGHAGIPGNERVDIIAQAFADKKAISLFQGKHEEYMLDLHKSFSNEKPKNKKSTKTSSQKAYSYLSLVNGILERHSTWSECEARVKGVPKAKFKKALSAENEAQILKEWGVKF